MAGLPPFAAARPLLLRLLLLLLKRARRARRWQSTDSHPVAIACRPAGGRGVHECLAGMRRFGQTIVASGKCAPCQPVTWPGCATPAPASGWGELCSASTSGRLWTIWYVGRKEDSHGRAAAKNECIARAGPPSQFPLLPWLFQSRLPLRVLLPPCCCCCRHRHSSCSCSFSCCCCCRHCCCTGSSSVHLLVNECQCQCFC